MGLKCDHLLIFGLVWMFWYFSELASFGRYKRQAAQNRFFVAAISAISARCAKALVFSRSREIIQELVSKIYLMSPPEESPAREAGDGSVVNVLGRGLVTDLALLCRRDQRIWPRLVSGIVLPWLPFRFPGIWYFDAFRGRRK